MLTLLTLDNVGRGLGNKHYLKGMIYEKDDKTTADHCEKYLNCCCDLGLLVLYAIDNNYYIQDPVHQEHNKIVGNMATDSIYPQPPQDVMEKYEQSITEFYNGKLNSLEGKGKGQGKDKGKAFGRFTPPSLEEVTLYCQEISSHINPQSFIDFYTAKGWLIGKTPMKDWRAALRTWDRRQVPTEPPKPKGAYL